MGFEESNADSYACFETSLMCPKPMDDGLVDDAIVDAKDRAMRKRIAVELGEIFELKDTDDVRFCIGCHITNSKEAQPERVVNDGRFGVER